MGAPSRSMTCVSTATNSTLDRNVACCASIATGTTADAIAVQRTSRAKEAGMWSLLSGCGFRDRDLRAEPHRGVLDVVHLHANEMRAAVTIDVFGLDAEHIVGRRLLEDAIERVRAV